MATLTKSTRAKVSLNGRTEHRMTVREFLALPDDEDYRTELIFGKMIVMSKPGADHNDLLNDLGQMLKRWVRFLGLGRICFDIDMILDAKKALVYAPDLLFLATENLDRLKKGKVHGLADLVIEILSPSDRPFLQNRKFTDYESFGIPWYWMIDPLADIPTLAEHQLVDGRYECRSEIAGEEWFEPGLFPGLVFRLPQLLAGNLKAAVKGKAKKLM
jgi:Uma2 family endonuclease